MKLKDAEILLLIYLFTKSKSRAFPCKDEDEGREELGQGGSHGIRVSGLIHPPKGISARWLHDLSDYSN